jgi:hypothetical protein
MMPDTKFTNDQLFWIVIAGSSCLTIGWCLTFFILRNKNDQMRALLGEGHLLRLLTVMLVVFATTLLAAMGALNQAVSAVFAGIVGYVLGSMRQKV